MVLQVLTNTMDWTDEAYVLNLKQINKHTSLSSLSFLKLFFFYKQFQKSIYLSLWKHFLFQLNNFSGFFIWNICFYIYILQKSASSMDSGYEKIVQCNSRAEYINFNILPNILLTNTNITLSWQSLVLMPNDLGNKSNFHWELFIWNETEWCPANKLADDYGTQL